MSTLRLIVAWLVMAAVPLQGLAAASMLFCDQGAVAAAAVHQEHAGHDHHHAYGHEAGADSAWQAHDSAQQAHGSKAPSGEQADADHACPICASCCQVVALSEAPSISAPADSPSAHLPQPRVPALTRASPRHDKPPRV